MKTIIFGMMLFGSISTFAKENPYRVGETIYYAEGKTPVIVDKILSPESFTVRSVDGKEKGDEYTSNFVRSVPCVYESPGYHASTEKLVGKIKKFCEGDTIYYVHTASSFRMNPKEYPVKIKNVFMDGRANIQSVEAGAELLYNRYLSNFRIVK